MTVVYASALLDRPPTRVYHTAITHRVRGHVVAAEPYNAFAIAQAHFDRVAEMLELDSGTRTLLRQPMREYAFSIPVRMQDGRSEVFRGFRVQYNDARGPAKGGIRFHPLETLDGIRALAAAMAWKCAVADIPLGGGKGGVVCDPHNLTPNELEGICRGWVRQVARDIGPYRDVPAPDVMTTSQHMLWMLDEYETLAGGRFPGAFTGKPVSMGGSLGRREATGFGLVFALREALLRLHVKPEATTAAVQGFGSVGQAAITMYHELGGTVIAVGCWNQADQKSYTFRRAEGIDLDVLVSITDRFGDISKSRAEGAGYEVLPGEAWLEQDVDILIPAALENQITEQNVGRIPDRVRVIAEGANGPTTPEADRELNRRGVYIIPDILGNAGGVTCSYFEQVQSNTNYFWEKDEVIGKLNVKMTSAFLDVAEFAEKKKLSMRDAAYVIGVDRVARACRDRGWV